MIEFDAVIVGAGVAGCATALELQALGLRVALLDRNRHISAVESLPPNAVSELRKWSIEEGSSAPDVVAWWGSDNEKRVSYPGARTVQRATLAKRVRACAIEQGVTLFELGKRLRFDWLSKFWSLEFAGQMGGCQVGSKYLVDATGRVAVVGRRLGAQRLIFDQLFCISTTVDAPDLTGTWTESTFDGWWNLCCVPEQGTLSFYSRAPKIREAAKDIAAKFLKTRHLRQLIAIADFSCPTVRPCGSSSLAPCAGANWFAVGDAASTLQPLTSAGIAKALADSRLVAKSIGNATNNYDHQQRVIFASYLSQLAGHYALEQRWATGLFWS